MGIIISAKYAVNVGGGQTDYDHAVPLGSAGIFPYTLPVVLTTATI